MIRFSYVFPRLFLVLAACLFLAFGLDPLARGILQQTGSALVGARVEVGGVRTHLPNGRVRLSRVQITDPRAPLKNLVQFDAAWLDIDASALCERRVVVDEGMIAGLRFGTDRAASGALPARGDEAGERSDRADRLVAQLSQHSHAWLDDLGDRLENDLESQFRSLQVARELAERWPREYQALEDKIRAWRDKITGLRDRIRTLREDPLRNIESAPRTIAELDQMRQQATEFRSELARLHARLQNDRIAIDAARRDDLQRVKELAHLDKIDPQAVTEYLLGEELAGRTSQLVAWLERGQQAMDYLVRAPQWNQQTGRGVDVLFGDRQPGLLVRSLAFSGTSRLNDQDLHFCGRAENLTPEPRLHGQPAVLEAATQGALAASIRAQLDGTGERPAYRFTMICPQIVQPATRLGKGDRFAVSVDPGEAALWLDLRCEGELLTGEVRYRQDRIVLHPVLPDRQRGGLLEAGLEQALGSVNRLHAAVELSGQLKRPTWRLRSNLGPQLATAIHTTARQQLVAHSERVAARAESKLNEQLAAVESLVAKQRERLTDELRVHEEQLASLRAQFQDKLKKPLGVLGGRLPADLMPR